MANGFLDKINLLKTPTSLSGPPLAEARRHTLTETLTGIHVHFQKVQKGRKIQHLFYTANTIVRENWLQNCLFWGEYENNRLSEKLAKHNLHHAL